jgi:hypothetical protein
VVARRRVGVILGVGLGAGLVRRYIKWGARMDVKRGVEIDTYLPIPPFQVL